MILSDKEAVFVDIVGKINPETKPQYCWLGFFMQRSNLKNYTTNLTFPYERLPEESRL